MSAPVRFIAAPCRRLLLILSLMVISGPSLGEDSAELMSILKRIQVTPPAQVPFKEQRKNRLLKEPMIVTGYLGYRAAGQMEKVIEAPFQEALRVNNDEISIVRGDSERRISLRNRRSFRVMLQSMEAIMAGDADTLEAYFDPAVSSTADGWRIVLTPRSKRLARQLIRLEVSGAQDRLDSIRFEMNNDEWHLLEIQHPETAHE